MITCPRLSSSLRFGNLRYSPRMLPEAHSPLLTWIVDALIRWRGRLLILALLATVAAWPMSRRLSFEQSIEALYATGNPHLEDFQASRSTFGGDEFLIVAYSETALFHPGSSNLTTSASERIENFAEQLSLVPGVSTSSTQHLAQALKFPFGRDHIRQMVSGMLLGSDDHTTAIVLRLLSEKDSPVSRGETIAKVRKLADAHKPPAMVVGEPAQIHDMFRYVEEDGRKLFLVSLALLALVLLLLLEAIQWQLLPRLALIALLNFVNWLPLLGFAMMLAMVWLRWVVLTVLVVLVSITWTEALLVLSGLRLSMVSSMLNSLITIIGVATSMHVLLFFREQHRTRSPEEALGHSILQLAKPVWWSIATTAFGFGVLVTSHINPVASFGLMMAIGTLVVFVAITVLLPGCLLFGRLPEEPPPSAADRYIGGILARITLWVEHHPRRVTTASVIVVALAGLGFLRLRVETDFSKNFRANSPIVRSLDFVESRLGGAGSWEVNFPAPRELDAEFLGRVKTLAERLRREFGSSGDMDHAGRLSKVYALTDGLDLIPERFPTLSFPFLRNATLTERLDALGKFQPEFVSSLYNPAKHRMRLMLRAYERQPSESKLQLIADVERLAQETFGNAAESPKPGETPPKSTGLFVLLAFLIDSLMADQWTSFLLSAVGITGMMWCAFRSLPFGLMSLVPNVFPNILVIGAMGWLGLPINIATAMIACVSMGLTVDSSIIYIDGYLRARASGLRVYPALHETHRHVGRALVYTNLALMAGFSVLALSHFIPLIYFGLLVSLAMFGGLIGNLVFLPLLIGWWDGRREQRQILATTGKH
ncbi:MAG: efflux RND transporter permease subunit [Planctomycetaceae bacterium]